MIRLLRQQARGTILELWTDGTVARRTGAGVAQLYLGPDEYHPRWTEKAPAGDCIDPYATESLAVKVGLARITKMRRPGPNKKVLIVYMDSQGLIAALQKGPVRQRDTQLASICKSLYIRPQNGVKRVIFQWIPAHCGVSRNESTDAAARQALHTFGSITQRRVPVRYQNIVSYYKEENKVYYLSVLQSAQNTRSTPGSYASQC